MQGKRPVGGDKAGNIYYIVEGPGNFFPINQRFLIKLDGSEHRYVEYADNNNMNSVPIEWYSWLRNIRQEPPTKEV